MNEIHEFDPQIYPFMLWVAKKPKYEVVKDKFYALIGDDVKDIGEDMFYRSATTYATCYPVCEKSSKRIGILVGMHMPKVMTAGCMAHEATHVCDFVCDRINMDCYTYDTGEPRAYLVQWITDCIDKVKRGKV